MKKEGSSSMRKNTFEKKDSIRFFWVNQFTLGQLHTRILNETDLANAIRFCWQQNPLLPGPGGARPTAIESC
jgi:hypothetical protein